MSDEMPKFQHDCRGCTFLGRFNDKDLYFCTQGSTWHHTVIARFGDDGPDYSSGLPFAVEGEFGIPELLEAKKRAIAKGLIHE